jgi:hypothetical protein
MLRGKVARVPLPDGNTQYIYACVAYVRLPYVTSNLRTPSNVERVVLLESIMLSHVSYIVPTLIAMDG